MKMVFIGGRSIHCIGGIETYMYNLCTYLAQHGHNVTYYCESDKDETEYFNNFRVCHQRSIKNIFLCKLYLGLKATIKSLKNDKDVDIYHYNATGPALSSIIPILLGKNVIVQSHGLEWMRTKWNPLQRKLLKALHDFVMFFSKNITAVSDEQTHYIKANNKKEATTITSAVNLPGKELVSNILEDFGLCCNGYFLFLGRLVKEKNPDILIDAYIKSGLSSKKLVIAGDNKADLKYVNYLHQKSGNNENIIFTGSVGGDDKEKLLKESFAFCIPSTLEGLPITLLEAMSYSKICIASDIPACKEALGNNGIWVKKESVDDMSEKLKFVCGNYESLELLGAANYERVLNFFTWNDIVKKYEGYCNRIISKKS